MRGHSSNVQQQLTAVSSSSEQQQLHPTLRSCSSQGWARSDKRAHNFRVNTKRFSDGDLVTFLSVGRPPNQPSRYFGGRVHVEKGWPRDTTEPREAPIRPLCSSKTGATSGKKVARWHTTSELRQHALQTAIWSISCQSAGLQLDLVYTFEDACKAKKGGCVTLLNRERRPSNASVAPGREQQVTRK